MTTPSLENHNFPALVEKLRWNKFPVLNDGFICLVDVMGDEDAILDAARVSFNKDNRDSNERFHDKAKKLFPEGGSSPYTSVNCSTSFNIPIDASKLNHDAGKGLLPSESQVVNAALAKDDAKLLRYLFRNRHSTPFEMAELKFLVRVPMDCWRQWIRHRTANVNEYSTRYTEAIDSTQTTAPDAWRSQSKSNKQGSGDFLPESDDTRLLSQQERELLAMTREIYERRIEKGVAKEQARKDLPLSTYTEAYWKIDLHNLFHFLGLRMDGHAQSEIRQYATIIGEQIVKPLFPNVWKAFEDYRLNGMFLSALDQQVISDLCDYVAELEGLLHGSPHTINSAKAAWSSITNEASDSPSRERDECFTKLRKLGFLPTAE